MGPEFKTGSLTLRLGEFEEKTPQTSVSSSVLMDGNDPLVGLSGMFNEMMYAKRAHDR